MVDEQIAARGVVDARVLAAMRCVPRAEFVDPAQRAHAYDDTPLGIGEEQTISQPYIVALMAEALLLRPSDRVLEIGTGSGYAAAVLAELAEEVYTIERHRCLADAAALRLQALGYARVHARCGDGTRGWVEAAPFDAISVPAATDVAPQAVLDQLAIGGRLVIPLGATPAQQELVRITRVSQLAYERVSLGAVRFVPLVGGPPSP